MNDPLQLSGVHFSERLVTVGDGTQLRVRSWVPERPALDWDIVFIPGWISLMQGWEHMLRVLCARQTVHYIETREKGSSVLSGRPRAGAFTIQRSADDLVDLCQGYDPDRTVYVAASLGASAITQSLRGGRLRARGAFLIAPALEFPDPWWLVPLTYLPSWLYPPIRTFVLWNLRTFRVDTQREPEQMARYELTLHAAEPTRLKLSARVFRGFRIWGLLDGLELPVGVAWAGSDTLHGAEAMHRLVDALPNARGYPCPTNLYLHRADVIAELDRFVASTAAAPPPSA